MTASSVKKIDVKLEQLEPGSVRYRVMFAVRQFRASWIELARVLREVLYNRAFEEWGYENFEEYCRCELGLKKPTVGKLLNSYDYMRENAPERLDAYEAQMDRGDFRSPPPEVPDYQTVDLLRKMADNRDLDDDAKDHFHRLAFEGGQEDTLLRKEIRAAMAPAETAFRSTDGQSMMTEIRRTSSQLRKMLHEAPFIPDGLRDRFDALLLELESLE